MTTKDPNRGYVLRNGRTYPEYCTECSGEIGTGPTAKPAPAGHLARIRMVRGLMVLAQESLKK